MTDVYRRLRDTWPAAQRIALIYRVELAKAIRLRQTYIGPLLLVGIVLLAPLAHPLSKDGAGDYGFIAYITPLALNFLGYLMILAYVGGLIATEFERGTLRAVLLRPVRREEVYLAKLLLGLSYSALVTFSVAAASWSMVLAFGDLYGIEVGGVLLYTSDEMAWTYAAGALLALAPQWAGVSLGLLYSTMTRSAVSAISLSIGTWIALDMVKYPLRIDGLIFTTYLEAPWDVFANRCDGLDAPWLPLAFYAVLSSLAVAIPATALGLALFHRRNLGTC